jgi:hypothetical protein
MPGPESWVTQSCLSQYIPSLPFDLVSFYLLVIYKRQVKLWCWASSRHKTIVNRNKVIEHFSKFLFLPSSFCCMLFVLNSVFHWVCLSLMMNYSHWFLCLVRFHVQNTKQWTLVLCWRLLNVIWGFVFCCIVGLLLGTGSVH